MAAAPWPNLFIKSKTPDEAAYQANVYYSNSQVRPKRRFRLLRSSPLAVAVKAGDRTHGGRCALRAPD
jgi:hypothetical protein